MTESGSAEPPDRTGAGEPVAVVILAAGAGKRMHSRLPKPLHPVAGKPMVAHVLDAAAGARPSVTALVVSPQTRSIAESLGHPDLRTVVQDTPRGTGDAVRVALPVIGDARWLVVLFADHPLLTRETVERLVEGARAHGANVTVLTTVLPNAASYGRIERDAQGRPVRIVEQKDDDAARRAGETEINSGMMVLDVDWARERLTRLGPSPVTGEFYLTDLIEHAVSEAPDSGQAWPVAVVEAEREVAIGINDRVQLAEADAIARGRIRERHMLNGVTIVAPETVLIDADVTIGPDTTILPYSMIAGVTSIGERCVIGPHALLTDAVVEDEAVIRASTVTASTILTGTDVGPYSHVRGGSVIGPHVHIGNFAELKQARIDAHVKVGHVSYIGDAQVGAGTNIGAGTITCNFDGVAKHRTEIGAGAFIGSDSMLVAPVTIGDGARTGAGSVVTKDVPAGATVVGIPARQIRRSSPRASAEPGEAVASEDGGEAGG